MDELFQRYVANRALVEPGTDGRKVILNDDRLLAELAGIWRAHKSAIEALLKSRIYPIERELVAEAHPYEVPTLRQAMVEVAFIGDDLETFAAEYERRQKEKEDPSIQQPNIAVSPAPQIEDNAQTLAENGREPSAV